MKKLIAILIIISVMICGCSQEEKISELPVTLAPISEPTKEPTKEVSQEPEVTHLTVICQFCNELPAEYVYKDYCLCQEDYMLALHNEADIENYNAIVEAANVASTDINVITDLASMGPAKIIVNQDGVSLQNSGVSLLTALEDCIPDLKNIKIRQECEIQIERTENGIRVTKTKQPIYWVDAIGK